MKRKLVKQGAATLMVSLPAKWTHEFGLKKGDEVDVEEVESSLVIKKEGISKKKSVTVEITEENKADIWWILSILYRRGFDIIKLNGVDSKLLKEIKSITKDLLLGFEVTERAEDSCKVESISEPTEERYETLLRRAFLIIKEKQSLVIEDFEKGKLESLEELKDLKNQQDKFILFCRRALAKKKQESFPMIKWELLTLLVHINHETFYFYKYASENKIKPDKKMVSLLEELKDYFELFYESYFKKDIKAIHTIQKLKSKLQYGKCEELIKTAKGKDAVAYAYIRSIFRRIQVGTSPILAEILEEKIE